MDPEQKSTITEETETEFSDNETDNEDEIEHDLVECEECGTKTHYSNGECSKCGNKFQMSVAGYLMTGEDGKFIADEHEDLSVYEDDSEEESECTYDSEDSEDSEEEQPEEIYLEEDTDYVYKHDNVVKTPMTITTRSKKRKLN